MINTLRLTHHILFYVVLGYMFRPSLTIIRPVCESILKMLATYWDPTMFTTITGTHTGIVVNIVGSQYVASICKTRFTNGPDDGQ